MKNKKLIVILSVLLTVIIGSVCFYVIVRHQGEPIINNQTVNNQPSNNTAYENNGQNENESDGGDDGPQAVISPSVTCYSIEDSAVINDAIKEVKSVTDGVRLTIPKGTKFDDLDIGDIFCLEGGEGTPFGMTYFGKISSYVEGDSDNTYLIETPGIDEVFDKLNLDYADVLTTENLKEVDCLDGITYETVDSVDNYVNASKTSTAATTDYSKNKVTGSSYTKTNTITPTGEGELLFKVEVDLLKTFSKLTNKEEKNPTVSAIESEKEDVYKTPSGLSYHTEKCKFVKTKKEKISLKKALDNGLKPCTVCKPPVIGNVQSELKLTGLIGFKSLDVNVQLDWDIMKGEGIKNLSINANGEFVSEVELSGNFKMDLKGCSTKIELFDKSLVFKGLNERLIPLIGMEFITTHAIVNSNEDIRNTTKNLPLSVFAIVFVDLDGNVSLGFKAYLNSTLEFDYTKTIIENYKFVDRETSDFDKEINAGFEAELSGDIDLNFGIGVDCYIFNLKVVNVDVAKLGLETTGSIKIDISNETLGKQQDIVSASCSGRFYFKVGDIALGFSMKTKLFGGLVSTSASLDFDFCLLDITIAEWGSKKPTAYDPDTMGASLLTAEDAKYIYYKNEEGKLIRERDNVRDIIYEDNFFTICGIDSSYLYLLVPNEDQSFDIRRVEKTGETSKIIVSGVSYCLSMDDTYIYYLTDFDKSTIKKLDRNTLEDSNYANFDKSVMYMESIDDNFFIVTADDDLISSLFGTTCYYMLYNSDGTLISDYGSSPAVENLPLYEFTNYYAASKIVSSGFLRDTSEYVCWLSKNKKNSVRTETLSGWNYFEEGIVTTVDNPDSSSTEDYQLIIYNGIDGSRRNGITVSSKYAFFTLLKGDLDEWYMFDQTDTELILYCIDSNLNNKKILKTFTKEEFAGDLENCSISIMDGKIYFYSVITGDKESQMIYRYELN